MTKKLTVEERLDAQEKRIAELEKENEKLWALNKRLSSRTDKLRLAQPHVQFQDW